MPPLSFYNLSGKKACDKIIASRKSKISEDKSAFYDLILDRIGLGIMTYSYDNNPYLCCISEETNEMDITKYNLSQV